MDQHRITPSERMDSLWQASLPTAAGRAASCGLAIRELPKELHAPWGPRAARCLMDISLPGNPFLPDCERSAHGADHASICISNHAADAAWAFFEHFVQHASLEAIHACFECLPNPASPCGPGADKSNMAAILFTRSLDRFCSASHFAELASMIRAGALLSRHDIPILLAHGGPALEHPDIAQACQRALRDELSLACARGDSLPARLYPRSFATCHSPLWSSILFDAISLGEPTRFELGNILCFRNTCAEAASLTDERAAEINEPHHRRGRRSSLQIAIPSEDRDCSARLLASANARWLERLSCMAQTQPHRAARILMEKPHEPMASYAAWQSVGLGSVDAAQFLSEPFNPIRRRGRGSAPPKRLWPSYVEPGKIEGLRLSHLDCMMLSGCSTEAILSQEALGSAPLGHLPDILECPSLFDNLSEASILWMTSVASRTTPASSKGSLRI